MLFELAVIDYVMFKLDQSFTILEYIYETKKSLAFLMIDLNMLEIEMKDMLNFAFPEENKKFESMIKNMMEDLSAQR